MRRQDLLATIERLQAALAVMCYEYGLKEVIIQIGEEKDAALELGAAGEISALRCDLDIARLKAIRPEDCGPFAETILG